MKFLSASLIKNIRSCWFGDLDISSKKDTPILQMTSIEDSESVDLKIRLFSASYLEELDPSTFHNRSEIDVEIYEIHRLRLTFPTSIECFPSTLTTCTSQPRHRCWFWR